VLNAIEQTGGYHRVSSSRENRGEEIRSPGNHGRFSRMLNTAISSSIMSEQSAGPTTQDILSVGILIIPRDLPCTGTPENISNPITVTSVSASNGFQSNSPDLEGDIELGTRSTNSRQNSFDGSPVDRSKYTALDFGLQILHPRVADEDGEVASIEYGDLFVHAGGSMFTSSDVYGLPGGGSGATRTGESHEHEGSTECVICLTEMQDVFLLPCRHLCVCKECFPHIDKCPVCRTPFDDYVTLRHDNLVSMKAPKCIDIGNAPIDDDSVHLTTDNGKMKTL